LPGLLVNNEMAQRSNRRSQNPDSEAAFQDCITKWEESVAHSILARSTFTPLKAVYICSNQRCLSHFSLASTRRTIHSGCAVMHYLLPSGNIRSCSPLNGIAAVPVLMRNPAC